MNFFATGRGQSFDVAHTDGLFFVDAQGRLRVAMVGTPNLHGRLSARLKRRLRGRGLIYLTRPVAGWSVAQALDDLERLLGREIPERPLP